MTPSKKRVILFGASEACRNFLATVKESPQDYPHHFIAIADNDLSKHGTSIDGLPVIEPKEILSQHFTGIIITSAYALQIQDQLLNELNIEPDLISQAPKYAMFKTKTKAPFEDNIAREHAEQLLHFLVQQFNLTGIRYFVDHGTLLGLIRDNGILPWDDDIDLSIHPEDLYDVKQLLQKHLKKLSHYANGIVNIFEHPRANNVTQVGLEVYRYEQYAYQVSIKTLTFRDGEAWQSITKAPEEHFIDADSYIWRGQEVRTPKNTEGYLTLHYGDWRTPKKNISFHDLGNYVEPKA